MKIGHDKKTNTMSYMNKEMAACFKDWAIRKDN
jgi:hypothetical protein